MALSDLLTAIEADAQAERELAAGQITAEAAVIRAQARQQASRLEAELSAATEPQALADAEHIRALARLDAASALREAREQAYGSLVADIETALGSLRDAPDYPKLFRRLLLESLAALPEAGELRVDPRDAELAASVADGLDIVEALDGWGGVELVAKDGRTVRNTLEERLHNADMPLRTRFAQWFATAPQVSAGGQP
jgi:vacuolar-type H+-ATPase subunit E/Vma4